MIILQLQVCWEWTKLFAYIYCPLFTGRVLLTSLLFPRPNNLAVVGLVQPEPAPILVWRLNEQALAPVSVQQ